MNNPITDPVVLRALQALRLPDTLIFAVLTPELRIERVSEAFCQFCGCAVADAEGKLLSEIMAEAVGNEDSFLAVLRGDAPMFEIRRIMRDAPNSAFTFSSLLVVPRDPDNPGAGLLALAQDTTEPGLLEMTLAQQRNDIASMQRELMAAADVLRERNRDLDSFSHTVAHDLKTPLSVIIGYVSIIEADLGEHAPTRTLRSLKQIQATVYMMSNIIHNLLLFARLRDTTEVISTVEMRGVVERSVARVSRRIEDRGVKLDVADALPDVLGYGPWIEEAFVNLIENAIKYIGLDNADPRVGIVVRAEADSVSYGIEDNGIGITTDNQARLFDAFSRFDTDQAEGFGLGLAIVGRIIAKLNGSISVASEVGQGTTFWVKLPASPPH